VVGLDNLNDYYDPTLKRARLAILEREPKFRFVKMDLADKGGIKALFAREKFPRVIHLARRPAFVTRSRTRRHTSTAT
jgi:UDP-glucuronate 4-epimerase